MSSVYIKLCFWLICLAGLACQTGMKFDATLSLRLPLAAGNLTAGTLAAAPDKSAFNLFNPVPTDLLRDLDTDRPDKTNSPHTLDAGHVQLKMNGFTVGNAFHKAAKMGDAAPLEMKA
ncbi:MAG: hypothetical protein ABI600_03855 [Luteolibacter sp.]